MSKIMLVDDALFMRMFVKEILKQEGYTDIIEAVDGEQAVLVYKEEHPDLVLLDITMPIKTGLEAIKEIISYDKNAQVIMCSAMGQQSMVFEAIKSGAKDFIVKPFQKDKIVSIIKKYLD